MHCDLYLMPTPDVAYLVRGLGTKGNEIPEHVSVLEVGLRVPLLGVDEAREEEGIADEEDGRVVPRKVPDSFVGV